MHDYDGTVRGVDNSDAAPAQVLHALDPYAPPAAPRGAGARPMKHVWILNHYAEEPGSPGVTRHFSLARHLPAAGWRATIIAASTSHGSGEQRLAEGETRRRDTIQGVPFVWLRARAYAGNGADRVLNMLDYTRAALRRDALRDLAPPDAIIGSSVHPFAAWAGRALARRYRVPFLFEVRDLWPQTLIDLGRISARHPAVLGLRWLERSLYESAERTIVLLPAASDYIVPLGIPRERIVWIPNGVDLDPFPPPPEPPASDTFTLMYLGSHGIANGLDNILSAMRIVQADPAGRRIAVRLIGHGAEKPRLIEMAKRMDLANVRFEAPVTKAEIPALVAEADAFLICVRNKPNLYRFGISMNKIYDYLAAARPTIISTNAANNPIAEANAGLTVPPESPEALARAILELAAMPHAERVEMGRAGRLHAESHYSMKKLAERLAATLDGCLVTA